MTTFYTKKHSKAQFTIVEDEAKKLVIRDIGPWNKFPTVTNDAEAVVADLAPQLKGRKLYYYDSQDELDQIVVKDGKFAGFLPVARQGFK